MFCLHGQVTNALETLEAEGIIFKVTVSYWRPTFIVIFKHNGESVCRLKMAG